MSSHTKIYISTVRSKDVIRSRRKELVYRSVKTQGSARRRTVYQYLHPYFKTYLVLAIKLMPACIERGSWKIPSNKYINGCF